MIWYSAFIAYFFSFLLSTVVYLVLSPDQAWSSHPHFLTFNYGWDNLVPDTQRNMFIVGPLTSSGLAKLFMTHSRTKERIERLLEIQY